MREKGSLAVRLSWKYRGGWFAINFIQRWVWSMKNVQSLRNAVLVSLLAGTTVVWGGTAFAAEDLQEFALDDMVITASRVPTQKVCLLYTSPSPRD